MKWISCDINDISDEEYRQTYLLLTDSRRERVDRLQNSDDKKRSLAGEILVRKLLLQEYDIENPQIAVGPKGKPQAQDAPCFSISHCENIVACAVNDTDIGIDVERIRTVKYSLIKRVCVNEELEYVSGTALMANGNLCASRDTLTRFFEVWTAKEAYFKKIGTGITDFKSVNTRTLKKQIFTVDDYMICVVL